MTIRLFSVIIMLGAAIALTGPATAADDSASFHHIHLNSTNPDATIEYYTRLLNATAIKYREKTDAVYTERSFFLINKVEEPPRTLLTTSLNHIGWAGKDGPSEYEWLKEQGVEFHTPVTALGDNYYMYFYGNDRELLEIYTGNQNYRFEHIHLYAVDVNATARWFVEHLGLEGRGDRPKPEAEGRIWSNRVRVDNVGIIIFEKPVPGHLLWEEGMKETFDPTQGSVIDHIAFSYRDIEPVYARMKEDGLDVMGPIATDDETGVTSFFVEGPEKLLVEIVQEKPIPEGVWE